MVGRCDKNLGLEVVRWNDNAVVTVLSNCHGTEPVKHVSRFSRTEKKRIMVSMPYMVSMYNSKMGGVDLNDQFVSNYRTSVTIKKWWWPFFAWAVDEAAVQGWLLLRQFGREMDLLQFRRECAMTLLRSFGSAPKLPGVRSSKTQIGSMSTIRLDGKDHLITVGESKYKTCKVCNRRTQYKCRKCELHLHPECFVEFHS